MQMIYCGESDRVMTSQVHQKLETENCDDKQISSSAEIHTLFK